MGSSVVIQQSWRTRIGPAGRSLPARLLAWGMQERGREPEVHDLPKMGAPKIGALRKIGGVEYAWSRECAREPSGFRRRFIR